MMPLLPDGVVGLVAQADPGRVEACGPEGEQDWVCRIAFDLTNSARTAEVAEVVSAPARVVLILVGAFVASRISKRVILRLADRIARRDTLVAVDKLTAAAAFDRGSEMSPADAQRKAQRTRTIGTVFNGLATLAIWTVAILWILRVLGVDIGPILAGAGFLGVALGFGAQKLIQDFTSGFFMIVEDQFGVGDIIDVGDTTGTVEHVSLRATQLRDVEGVLWHVPNGEIRRVANKSQKWARVVLDIDVAYDTDIMKAREVILAVATAMYRDPEWGGDEILEAPEVWGVEAFGADAVSIRLVVKTAPLEQWVVARELRYRIKTAFDEEGIEIPFPQRTVWIRSDANGQAE